MRKAAYFCIALFCVLAMVGTASAATPRTVRSFQLHGNAIFTGGAIARNATITLVTAVFPGPNIVRQQTVTNINGEYYFWGPDYIPTGSDVSLFIFGRTFSGGIPRSDSITGRIPSLPDPADLIVNPANPGAWSAWYHDGLQLVGAGGLLGVSGFPIRLDITTPDITF